MSTGPTGSSDHFRNGAVDEMAARMVLLAAEAFAARAVELRRMDESGISFRAAEDGPGLEDSLLAADRYFANAAKRHAELGLASSEPIERRRAEVWESFGRWRRGIEVRSQFASDDVRGKQALREAADLLWEHSVGSASNVEPGPRWLDDSLRWLHWTLSSTSEEDLIGVVERLRQLPEVRSGPELIAFGIHGTEVLDRVRPERNFEPRQLLLLNGLLLAQAHGLAELFRDGIRSHRDSDDLARAMVHGSKATQMLRGFAQMIGSTPLGGDPAEAKAAISALRESILLWRHVIGFREEDVRLADGVLVTALQEAPTGVIAVALSLADVERAINQRAHDHEPFDRTTLEGALAAALAPLHMAREQLVEQGAGNGIVEHIDAEVLAHLLSDAGDGGLTGDEVAALAAAAREYLDRNQVACPPDRLVDLLWAELWERAQDEGRLVDASDLGALGAAMDDDEVRAVLDALLRVDATASTAPTALAGGESVAAGDGLLQLARAGCSRWLAEGRQAQLLQALGTSDERMNALSAKLLEDLSEEEGLTDGQREALRGACDRELMLATLAGDGQAAQRWAERCERATAAEAAALARSSIGLLARAGTDGTPADPRGVAALVGPAAASATAAEVTEELWGAATSAAARSAGEGLGASARLSEYIDEAHAWDVPRSLRMKARLPISEEDAARLQGAWSASSRRENWAKRLPMSSPSLILGAYGQLSASEWSIGDAQALGAALARVTTPPEPALRFDQFRLPDGTDLDGPTDPNGKQPLPKRVRRVSRPGGIAGSAGARGAGAERPRGSDGASALPLPPPKGFKRPQQPPGAGRGF